METFIFLPFRLVGTVFIPFVFGSSPLRNSNPGKLIMMIIFLTPYIAIPIYAFLFALAHQVFRNRKVILPGGVPRDEEE